MPSAGAATPMDACSHETTAAVITPAATPGLCTSTSASGGAGGFTAAGGTRHRLRASDAAAASCRHAVPHTASRHADSSGIKHAAAQVVLLLPPAAPPRHCCHTAGQTAASLHWALV